MENYSSQSESINDDFNALQVTGDYSTPTPQDQENDEIMQFLELVNEKLSRLSIQPSVNPKLLNEDEIFSFLIETSTAYQEILEQLRENIKLDLFFNNDKVFVEENPIQNQGSVQTTSQDTSNAQQTANTGTPESFEFYKSSDIIEEFIREIVDQNMLLKIQEKYHAYLVYLSCLVEVDMCIIRAEIDQVLEILEEDYLGGSSYRLDIEKIGQQLKSFKDVKITTLQNKFIQIVDNRFEEKLVPLTEQYYRFLYQNQLKHIQSIVLEKCDALMTKILNQLTPNFDNSKQAQVQYNWDKQFHEFLQKFQIDIQFSKIQMDQLLYCVAGFISANLPCSQKRFMEIQIFLQNLAGLKSENEQQKLNQEIKEQMDNYRDKQSSFAKDMRIISGQQIQMLEKTQLMELVIFLYLGGTGSINQECEAQITKVDSSQRQMMLNFLKLLYKNQNQEYTMIMGSLENCLDSLQQEEVVTNEDFEIVQNFVIREHTSFNIGTYLIKKPSEKQALSEKCNNYIYQGNNLKIQQRTLVINKTLQKFFQICKKIDLYIPKVSLKKISSSEKNSKHVQIICSSMDGSDKQQSNLRWAGLLKCQENQNIDTYILNWNQTSLSQIFRQIIEFTVSTQIFNVQELEFSKKSNYLMKIIANLVKITRIFNPLNNINMIFKDAKKKAKQVGKMLACSLALGYPFLGKSISLIGFSFGCQVIQSCLKTLYDVGADDIIQNVTFICGTNQFNPAKSEKWEMIFSQVVNGKIKNLFSDKDVLLLFFKMTEKVNCVGNWRIFEKSQRNLKSIDNKKNQNNEALCMNAFKLRNYNISSMIKFGNTIKQISNQFYYQILLTELVTYTKIEK
ncbi:UNKNOWN [Stylonychia lemnae]|uniref:DUF726 domain-containing protein n=1 Tax=Stylonychia lemnae TaxID=5949 RepID=A0A077ZXV1_STYLE|nr:UNKNOWN [Stylonychia lemnae]|eukprot:CDW73356.1 UNKNOWN [Stylonychia lemnae]